MQGDIVRILLLALTKPSICMYICCLLYPPRLLLELKSVFAQKDFSCHAASCPKSRRRLLRSKDPAAGPAWGQALPVVLLCQSAAAEVPCNLFLLHCWSNSSSSSRSGHNFSFLRSPVYISIAAIHRPDIRPFTVAFFLILKIS